MARNNYPQAGLNEIDPGAVQQIVTSLKELHDLGKPETDEEVAKRIDDYFEFCQRSSIRPVSSNSVEDISALFPAN